MEKIIKRNKWSDAKESAFIDLWKEEASELNGPRKKTHVYSEMAKTMSSNGFLMTAADIKMKINNLTTKYRKEKEAIGVTGASDWKWYDNVHQIIGDYKSVNCSEFFEKSFTVNEGNEFYTECNELFNSEEASCSGVREASPESRATSAVRVTSKKKNNQSEILAYIKESNEMLINELQDLKKFDKELIDLEAQKVALLRRHVESSEEVNKGVLNFLQNYNKKKKN